ncbi:MAG: RHS repeat-associated core domain-containing protein [Fimbriimonadales bacterium]
MPTVRYTVANGEIIAEKRGGVRRSYVPDPLGSTIALLDNTQTKTDTFSYWPYGEVQSRTGTTATPFQFVGTLGYYRDATDRMYVRARYLRPNMGRWQTVDPLWPRLELRPYAYAENAPPTLRDKTGLHPCDERTRQYCEIAERFKGKARALNCFCRVSRILCDNIIKDPLGTFSHDTRAWFDCLNRCMFNIFHFTDSDWWRTTIRGCREVGFDNHECCAMMVHSEQEALEECVNKCSKMKDAGRPPEWWWWCTKDNPNREMSERISGLPLFPFADDTSARTSAAIRLCCEGKWGDPVGK